MCYESLLRYPIINEEYKTKIINLFSNLLTILLEYSDNPIPIPLLEETLYVFHNTLSKLDKNSKKKKKTKKNK
jgi:hypothetical protein